MLLDIKTITGLTIIVINIVTLILIYRKFQWMKRNPLKTLIIKDYLTKHTNRYTYYVPQVTLKEDENIAFSLKEQLEEPNKGSEIKAYVDTQNKEAVLSTEKRNVYTILIISVLSLLYMSYSLNIN